MTESAKEGTSSGKLMRQRLKSTFKGKTEPATVEMIAEIWAQMTLLQEAMINIAQIVGPNSDTQIKNRGFIDLADNLQESLDGISQSLKSLPGGAGNGRRKRS